MDNINILSFVVATIITIMAIMISVCRKEALRKPLQTPITLKDYITITTIVVLVVIVIGMVITLCRY